MPGSIALPRRPALACNNARRDTLDSVTRSNSLVLIVKSSRKILEKSAHADAPREQANCLRGPLRARAVLLQPSLTPAFPIHHLSQFHFRRIISSYDISRPPQELCGSGGM